MASTPESVEEAIDTLKRGMPERKTMTLHDNGGGTRINVMADAIDESPVSAGEKVDEWWFENKQLLVIDLGGDDGAE